MTRRTAWMAAALLWGSAASAAVADPGCRQNEKLSKVASSGALSGNLTSVLSSSAQEIRLINVGCEGTACLAGLYDASSVADTATLNGTPLIEPGAAASTGDLLPQNGFFEQPLTFNNGIVFKDDGNVAFIALYACTER